MLTPEQLIIVRDHTLLDQQRILSLCAATEQTKQLPGSMAELGVFRGGSALAMGLSATEKHLHLFDTFSGLPNDDPDGYNKKGSFSARFDDVYLFLGSLLGEARLHFHVGVFPEPSTIGFDIKPLSESFLSQPTTFAEGFSLVHFDADTYKAARDAIDWFWPRIVPGGIMVFDDAMDKPDCSGVSRALRETFKPGEIDQVVDRQVWVRKTR